MGVRASVTKIRNASFDLTSYNEARPKASRETEQVRGIFFQLHPLESRWRHVLDNGKLDGRRLSKVGMGKTTVFKIREKKNRPSLAIILLLDVSASMRSHLTKVGMTACIFSEALTPLCPRVWHEVVTYTKNTHNPLHRRPSQGQIRSQASVGAVSQRTRRCYHHICSSRSGRPLW